MILFIFVTAVVRAANIARQADVVAALTLDVLKGTNSAFESRRFLSSILPGQI